MDVPEAGGKVCLGMLDPAQQVQEGEGEGEGGGEGQFEAGDPVVGQDGESFLHLPSHVPPPPPSPDSDKSNVNEGTDLSLMVRSQSRENHHGDGASKFRYRFDDPLSLLSFLFTSTGKDATFIVQHPLAIEQLDADRISSKFGNLRRFFPVENMEAVRSTQKVEFTSISGIAQFTSISGIAQQLPIDG